MYYLTLLMNKYSKSKKKAVKFLGFSQGQLKSLRNSLIW